MLGRRARDEPYLFARAGELYGDMRGGPTRREVLRRYCDYAARAQRAGCDAKTPAQEARALLAPRPHPHPHPHPNPYPHPHPHPKPKPKPKPKPHPQPSPSQARALLTPLSGLFHGTRCGKRWSQALSAIMQERERLGSVPVPELVARALQASQMADAVLDARPEDPLLPYLPHTPRAAEAEAEAECDECPAREPPGTALEPTPEPTGTAARGTQAVQGSPGEARRRPPCTKRAPPPCSPPPPPPPPPPSLTVGLSAQAVCLAAASAVALAALLVAASRRGSR